MKKITLKEARKRANLTQEELSDLTKKLRGGGGLKVGTIAKIEQGRVADPLSSSVEVLEKALCLERGTLVF
jgi:transcriptional regulator with XRE-family HTH domain